MIFSQLAGKPILSRSCSSVRWGHCLSTDFISFERVAGGAPANVSAVVAKLGGKSNFISKLGKDAFGDYIIETLKEANVNTDYVLRTDKANTGS